ncbi:MAG: thiamine phosphate synthase [Citrobacter freundii]|nr:MAG: thiamine phosphate synthase [Citrobacter freundii]
MHSFPYHLYLVIGEATCNGKDFLEVADQAIQGGVDLMQLREKELSYPEFVYRAKLLKSITDKYNVPLIINDNADVMSEVHAAGIHVGNSDASPADIRKKYGDGLIVGYSVEQIAQVTNERARQSDYIAASPVFSTLTKTDTIIEWGLAGLNNIRKLTSKPLVAIGNMNLYNAATVIRAGADCIAVVSAICSAVDPRKAAHELKKMICDEKEI